MQALWRGVSWFNWHRQEWNTMQRVGRDDEREEEEGGDQQREKSVSGRW